jgi:hypothetical protein
MERAKLTQAYLKGIFYTTDEFFNRLIKWWTPLLAQRITLFRNVPVIKHVIQQMKPIKVTNFLEVDTEEVDGSKNPVLKRYMQDYQFIQGLREKTFFHRKLFYPIWKVTCDCGRSLSIWAFWSFSIALLFGFIYAPYTCPSWLPNPIQDILCLFDPKIHIDPYTYQHNLWTSIYFSIVTFTTLGFGDVQPQNGAGLFWVALEVIIGYIMLGGLISIFATKLARRA